MNGSSTKVSCWRRCQKRAFYQYALEIERVVPSIAPSKGRIIHECLEYHYSGKDWTEPIKNLAIDLDNVFDEEREQWANLPDELYRIIRGYLLTHREDDSRYDVLATELDFNMKVGSHTFEGRIDKVVREKGSNRVWVVDYKTASDIPDVTELFMDVQTCMYAKAVATGAVAIPVKKGDTVGIMYDHIRTKAPRRPSILKNGTVSKADCVTDLATYMDTVKAQGLDPKDYADMLPKLSKHVFYRRAAIPVRKSTLNTIVNEIDSTLTDMEAAFDSSISTVHKDDYEELLKVGHYFPRTYLFKRCNWDCPYYKLCVGELSGQNVLSIIATEYQKRPSRAKDNEDDVDE